MRPVHFYLAVFSSVFVSCVSTGKYKAMQAEAQKYDTLYIWSMRTLKSCQDNNNELSKQKTSLQDKTNEMNLLLTATQENNSQLRKQLLAISAISSSQAESIKKSLDNIGAKDEYIQDLQGAVAHRDSVNLVLVMNLKAMLGGFGEDVSIKLEKGIVCVDLSDKILFNGDSTSYTLADKAKGVVGRLARVMNDQPDLEFMVEGHTDSVSYPDSVLPVDNWELSLKRASAVVRMLQTQYNVSPARMIAAGRSEYVTVAGNDTPEGRAANRRTRIVIYPQLEQLFRVIEHRQKQGASPATAASGS